VPGLLPSPGTRWMLGAAASFAAMAACAKALDRIPALDKVFWRSLFSVAATLWMLRHARGPFRPRRPGLLLLRGVLGFCGLTAYFLAVARIPLGNAVLLQNTNPLFGGLAAALFLREPFHRGQALAILIALLGVALVARPVPGAPLDGAFFALASAFFAGCAYATVRGLHRSEHPLVIVLAFPLVAIPLALLGTRGHLVLPRGGEWLWLLALGLTTQAGQVCLTLGLRAHAAARALQVNMTGVLFAVLLGWLGWGELPGSLAAAGAALILLSLAAYRPPVATAPPSGPPPPPA